MQNLSFRRILLATDESEQADAAVNVAASFALASGAAVRVVHVWNLEVHHRHGVWDVETRSEAGQLISQAVKRLRAMGVDADGEISRADNEHVGSAIAGVARQFGADLVVVGSRGLTEWQAMLRHSVSRDVLSAVDCPVLIVRGREDGAAGGPRRVLLAIAGGEDVTRGIHAAIAAAAAPASKVLVLHVAQAVFGAQGFSYVESDEDIQATVEAATAILKDAGVQSEVRVAEPGPVARLVADTAAGWKADVIVIGSSRMGNLASMLFGSVTRELLRGTTLPILVAERAHA